MALVLDMETFVELVIPEPVPPPTDPSDAVQDELLCIAIVPIPVVTGKDTVIAVMASVPVSVVRINELT